MPKRRMPNVMRQRQRFGQFCIQPKRSSQRPRNLSHFQRMRKSAAKVV